MDLTLVDMPGGFDTHVGFNERWWRPRTFGRPAQNPSTWLSVADRQGAEVARVELLERAHLSEYGIRDSPAFMQVQFIEVRHDLQRNGGHLGLMVLDLLGDHLPDRQFVAFSEQDEFWEKTGWDRHVRRGDDPRTPLSRPLYVQPA